MIENNVCKDYDVIQSPPTRYLKPINIRIINKYNLNK